MLATDWSLDFTSAPYGIKTLHSLLWRLPLDASQERWLKASRKEQNRLNCVQAKKHVPKHLRAIRAFPPWNVPENTPLIGASIPTENKMPRGWGGPYDPAVSAP